MRIFFLFLAWISLSAEVHHHEVDSPENAYVWEVAGLEPFEELIISWNSVRPKKGFFSISVSLQTEEWSPWLPYAEWGGEGQRGFSVKEGPVQVNLDAVQAKEKRACGFRIQIVGHEGAKGEDFFALHACTSNPSEIFSQKGPFRHLSIELPVAGLSQMALSDPRGNRLCSPTSTTAVIRYLQGENSLDPIEFAERSWDSAFDIFGNWVLNVAAAYHEIRETPYWCWVERLGSFEEILDGLERGMPTVISVRGPLPGSATPYQSGHLLAVIGFDAEKEQVLCMDPAFPSDEETIVRYALSDLLEAWQRRKNIAYVFAPRKVLRQKLPPL